MTLGGTYEEADNNVIYSGTSESLRANNNVSQSLLEGNPSMCFYSTGTSGVMENNVLHKAPDISTGVKQFNNIISNDPKFVDSTNGDFRLASGSVLRDAGKPGAEYYDPYDKVKYPTPDPPDTTPALPPAKGTIKTDIGAYGGPHAGEIGFVMPTEDDPSTPLIREDVIGTY